MKTTSIYIKQVWSGSVAQFETSGGLWTGSIEQKTSVADEAAWMTWKTQILTKWLRCQGARSFLYNLPYPVPAQGGALKQAILTYAIKEKLLV